MSDAEAPIEHAVDLELGPGDLLHVPRGWPHEVWTEGSHSAHLTFGFHLVSWVDVLMAVVARASREHAALREALPIGFARIAPDSAAVRERTRSLLDLLPTMDGAEAMEEVIARWMHRDMEVAPPDRKPAAAIPVNDELRLGRTGPLAFVTRADSAGLFRPSHSSSELWLPRAFAKPLQFVATVEPPEFAVKDLPGVLASGRTRLCEMLLAEGYVEPVQPAGLTEA